MSREMNTANTARAAMAMVVLFALAGFVNAQAATSASYTRLAPYLTVVPGLDATSIRSGMFDFNGLLTANGMGSGLIMGDFGAIFKSTGPVAASVVPLPAASTGTAKITLIDFAGDMQVHVSGSGIITSISAPVAATANNVMPRAYSVTGRDYSLSVSGSNVAIMISGGWTGTVNAVGKGSASFVGMNYATSDVPVSVSSAVNVATDKGSYVYPGTATITVTNNGNTGVYFIGFNPTGTGSMAYPVIDQKLVDGEWVNVMTSQLPVPQLVTTGAGNAASVTSIANPGQQPNEVLLAPGQSVSTSFDFNVYLGPLGSMQNAGVYLGDSTYRAVFNYYPQAGSKELREAIGYPYTVTQGTYKTNASSAKPPQPLSPSGVGQVQTPVTLVEGNSTMAIGSAAAGSDRVADVLAEILRGIY